MYNFHGKVMQLMPVFLLATVSFKLAVAYPYLSDKRKLL